MHEIPGEFIDSNLRDLGEQAYHVVIDSEHPLEEVIAQGTLGKLPYVEGTASAPGQALGLAELGTVRDVVGDERADEFFQETAYIDRIQENAMRRLGRGFFFTRWH